MSKYINPFTDYGFKYIFGRESNKMFLIDFLNELFREEKGFEPIVNVEYSDKEQPKVNTSERGVIYDILCTTSSGHQLIVEMQNKSQSYFVDRSVYYVSRSIVEQGVTGDIWKYEYKPVFMVSFMNFGLSALGNKLRTDVMLCDLDTHEPLSDKVRLVYIQLARFNKTKPEECVTALDKWLYILINMETMERMPFADGNNIFGKFENMVSYASLSKEERHSYDQSLKAYRDYINQIDYAKEEGIEIGIEKGIDIGTKRSIDALHKRGMDAEEIADMLDLSTDKVQYFLNMK